MFVRNRNAFVAVLCLCLISTVRGQLPQQETYDYCDSELELCEVFTDHVMCKYPVPGLSPQCVTTAQEPLSGTEKKRIMFWHNKFRSNVANGTEKNKTRKLPTASNMRQIYWDPELETLAARWADQCTSTTNPMMYDKCRNTKRFQVSQNVGTRKVNATTIDKQAPQIVITWYKESKDFEPALVDSFTPSNDNGVSVRQFANIINADTYAIGCARVIFQEQNAKEPVWTVERLVCNYGPGGSEIGKPIYKRGLPCGSCPPGTQCSRVFPGLCAIQNVDKTETQQIDTHETEKETVKEQTSTPEASVTYKPLEDTTIEDEPELRYLSPSVPRMKEDPQLEEDCEGGECLRKMEFPIDPRRRFDEIIRVARPTEVEGPIEALADPLDPHSGTYVRMSTHQFTVVFLARKKSREVGTAAPGQRDDIYSEKRKWIVSNGRKVRRYEWDDRWLKNGDKCRCFFEVHRQQVHDGASTINRFFFLIFFSSFTLYLL